MRQIWLSVLYLMGILAAFCGWYAIAANYDYSALAGTYSAKQGGDLWLLRLRADQTFTEQVRHAERTERIAGTWCRFGEAHVSFAREFVPLPGEEFDRSGEDYGQFR